MKAQVKAQGTLHDSYPTLRGLCRQGAVPCNLCARPSLVAAAALWSGFRRGCIAALSTMAAPCTPARRSAPTYAAFLPCIPAPPTPCSLSSGRSRCRRRSLCRP